MIVMVRPAVSVVAPCFDEEDVRPLFLSRIGCVLDSSGGASELVLADEGLALFPIRDGVGGAEGWAAATERANLPAIPSTTISA
jgi:hypothetical protein